MDDKTLLIYAPVPLHRRDGVLLQEDQACNGLRLWAENFRKLIVMMPLDPGPAPASWVPLSHVGPNLDRIEVVPLPMAYRPDQFLRVLGPVRRQIRGLIRRADYIGFAIGGLFGDWGSVASYEAHRMGRRFYVWTDRVESAVVRQSAGSGPLKHRLRAGLTHRPMAALERALIRRAALGLFHGGETFETYAPHSPNPQLVHDIHIARADHIAPAALEAKRRDVAEGPLRLCYVGRAEPMKGGLDWVEALRRAIAAGADVTAVWLGDGSDLPEMRARVAAAGLGERIRLPGFVRDRAEVLAALRQAHGLLFCHKTPESPRCLIEALISGAPILGYGGAFARGLIAENGGGVLVPLDDVAALAAQIGRLAADRAEVADLMRRAAADGAHFDDEAVFAHRSALIRQHLGG